MRQNNTPAPPCALTIAGSDSCGGAGIQADLKTFERFSVAGASAITAVTAQNTLGVRDVVTLDAEQVGAQLDAVLEDLPVAAAKTGMVANAAIIEAIAGRLAAREGPPPLVVDPVMVATSGARLLDADAERALVGKLLPLAALVTPNRPEAAVLSGTSEDTPPGEQARALLETGCRAVLLKGGHGSGETVEDWLVTENGSRCFRHPRRRQRIHGTGCALSAAIAALMARGQPLEEAVADAIEWLQSELDRTWRPLAGELEMLPVSPDARRSRR